MSNKTKNLKFNYDKNEENLESKVYLNNINFLNNKTKLKKNIISKNTEQFLEIKETKKKLFDNSFFSDKEYNENKSENKNLNDLQNAAENNYEKFENKLLINSKNKNNYTLIGEIIELIKNKKYNPYNPILLRGNNETSKTYILECIKNALEKESFYCLSKELSLYLSDKEDIKNFIKELTKYKVLIIDDIQNIANNLFLQEELCFIIDKIFKQNKSIIISINTEKKHKELSQELLNRISMGLVITLPEPDLDVKMQFVRLCLEENNIELSKELSLYVARKCQSLRKIKSAIINIKIFYNHLKYLPNINDLEIILKSTGNSIHLDYEYIMSVVGKKYGYTSKEIKSDKRDQRLIEARQISMYIARTLLGDTYQKIGKHFGGKDHTTVIYSIRKIEKIIVRNKDMHNTVTELANMCKV